MPMKERKATTSTSVSGGPCLCEAAIVAEGRAARSSMTTPNAARSAAA